MAKIVRSFAVVLLCALAGCSSAGTPAGGGGTTDPAGPATAPPPVRGGSLVVGTSGEVDGLNPLSSQWSGPAYQMGRAVLDPLVVMDTDGRWQPYLVRAITPNADFTVWTFELRPGIRFHNGEALDAAALAQFFTAAITSPLSSQGFPEKPVVTVVDPSKVTLTFTKPWSAMPTALTEQTGYVIAPAQILSGDAKHPIGTGPFVFDDWVPDDHFRATRNPAYWREGLPYLDRIEFRPVPDPKARLNALEAGDVDAAEANSESAATLDGLRAAGLKVIDDFDNVGATNLLMNTQKAPLDDRRVRQAVVAAIDREAYRDTLLDPSFEPADQPYPPGSPWHADIDYPRYDPDLARRLVSEHEAEHGPVQFTIMIVAGASATLRSQYLQQQFEAVGIDVTIESLELSAYVRRFVLGDYQGVFLGSFFGAADPDGSYPFIASSGAAPDALIKLNFARYRSSVVDAALTEQRTTDDRTRRQAAWKTIWQAFATDLPYAFLAFDRTAWATKADVHGLDHPTTPEGVALPAINRWTPFYTAVYRAG